MTPQAHRVSPCPGCATCRASARSARRERLLALAVIAVFVGLFVLPTVLGWHG